MRVLFFYCDEFGLKTFRKSVPEAPEDERAEELRDTLVCLVHGEPADDAKTVTRLVKNAKWLCGKFESRRVVLHFFAHLGEDKGDPERAREHLEAARDRLVAADYEARVMPFGYFCSLDLSVRGESLAKVFKVL